MVGFRWHNARPIPGAIATRLSRIHGIDAPGHTPYPILTVTVNKRAHIGQAASGAHQAVPVAVIVAVPA